MADPGSLALAAPSACPKCGTALAANLLSCPGCGWLVHSEELKRLAEEAGRAAQPADALRAWRRALPLLPTGSRQRAAVIQKIETLVPLANSPSFPIPAEGAAKSDTPKSLWQRMLAAVGVSAAFIAKFKFLALTVLTKAKLLLLGFTKMGTLVSMTASLGLYWTFWGWRFALGLVVSIYVHEMGHVAALSRLGIRAEPPMFIPGFGAFVRWREKLATPREEARVGLAGPMWGLGAAIVAYALSLAFDSAMMREIAIFGAWLNLVNLTPVWILDGSCAFRAFTRNQRWIVVAVVAVVLVVSSITILWAVLLFAVIRAWEKDAPTEPDHVGLGEYVFLVAGLSLIAGLHGTAVRPT